MVVTVADDVRASPASTLAEGPVEGPVEAGADVPATVGRSAVRTRRLGFTPRTEAVRTLARTYADGPLDGTRQAKEQESLHVSHEVSKLTGEVYTLIQQAWTSRPLLPLLKGGQSRGD